jgi:2-phospho-L-lactate guanylyltransferase
MIQKQPLSVTAIIPVKPLRQGKSRLAGVLTEEERLNLSQRMLLQTLEVLENMPEVGCVLVVSRDPAVARLAGEHGAIPIFEESTTGLNLALEQASRTAKQFYPQQSTLVLPVDLPLIDAAGLRLIIEHDPGPPGVVIVPDRHHTGTNALLVNPPGWMGYSFGPGSFGKHCEMAKTTGAELVILEIPSLALDLDLPEDLNYYQDRLEVL